MARKKAHSLKAEPLGGRTVSEPVAIPTRPAIDAEYISRYVEMLSQRREQQGHGLWPVGLREKMRAECAGLLRKRELKAVVAKLAKLKVEDL